MTSFSEDYMDGGSSEESDSNPESVHAPSSQDTKSKLRSDSSGAEGAKYIFSGDPTLSAQFVSTYVPILSQAYHSTLSRTVKSVSHRVQWYHEYFNFLPV